MLKIKELREKILNSKCPNDKMSRNLPIKPAILYFTLSRSQLSHVMPEDFKVLYDIHNICPIFRTREICSTVTRIFLLTDTRICRDAASARTNARR